MILIFLFERMTWCCVTLSLVEIDPSSMWFPFGLGKVQRHTFMWLLLNFNTKCGLYYWQVNPSRVFTDYFSHKAKALSGSWPYKYRDPFILLKQKWGLNCVSCEYSPIIRKKRSRWPRSLCSVRTEFHVGQSRAYQSRRSKLVRKSICHTYIKRQRVLFLSHLNTTQLL